MTTAGTTLGHLEHAGFEIRDVHMMREHYVRTCREWLATFEANADELGKIADAAAIRVWRLYLAGVALSFEENRMGVNQILATRTTESGNAHMPATRSSWE
jgi:cyclopropane-fatty-acyl-phospholipid synthase